MVYNRKQVCNIVFNITVINLVDYSETIYMPHGDLGQIIQAPRSPQPSLAGSSVKIVPLPG